MKRHDTRRALPGTERVLTPVARLIQRHRTVEKHLALKEDLAAESGGLHELARELAWLRSEIGAALAARRRRRVLYVAPA